MPGGDRTGPDSYGPRTGRSQGYCTGYDSPGFTKGLPRGRGFWCRGYQPEPYYKPAPHYRDTYPVPNRENEKTYLENMIKGLERELKAIQERLQDLSKEKKESP